MDGIGQVKYYTIVDYHKNKDTSNIGNSTDIIVSLHTLHHSTPQNTNF
jgi:hypothetical protein